MNLAARKEEWCKRNTVNYLDELGKSQPNFDYVKKELVDGVMVETTPNDKYRPVVEDEK